MPEYFQKYLDAKFEGIYNRLDNLELSQRTSSMKWGGAAGAVLSIAWEILKSSFGIKT